MVSLPATSTAETTTRTGHDDLLSARRVLGVEAAALTALSASLGDTFSRALAVFAETEGRVVVTGMGKSGHVARKIAATLASTGTASFYVHPGEASHGDLGMILEDDAVLALSNSGETTELADVVAHCKRFAIPLVAMTSRAGSALDLAADVSLVLPDSPEACLLGLAPTTSTTVMLALGDAIAVTLLERRNFSHADFKALHPGGKLGRRLLKVADLMHTGDEIPTTTGDVKMSDVVVMMTAKRFGCVAVVDGEGRLEGVITDGDLRRHMSADFLTHEAADVMTRGAKTIGPDVLAGEALQVMNALSITNLFVVADGFPVGILHVHDCLRAGVA